MSIENNPTPDINNIAVSNLVDNDQLADLYLQFVSRGFLANSERNFREFVCYAQKALDEDQYGTPGKLFYALIKAKEGRISQDQEDRALARFSSKQRFQIVESVGAGKAVIQAASTKTIVAEEVKERNIGFLPAAAVQCFFPQKQLPDNVRDWQMSHGECELLIEGGRISKRGDPRTFRYCSVPYGYLARLLFAYISGQAVQTRSRHISLGHSMTKFMKRIGVAMDGRSGKKLVTAVEDIAAASFYLGYWTRDGSTHTKFARVANRASFWQMPKDENQVTLWTPEMEISADFYEQLQDHRVPIDIDHLASLTRSPRRMDLYTWLAYRTHAIKEGRRDAIPVRYLKPVFAPDIESIRLFKQRLKADLVAIGKVYPRFRAEVRDDVLVLHQSPPPVPPATSILIPSKLL